jgi:ribosomal protein S18 acetylase RimI-like enzyme
VEKLCSQNIFNFSEGSKMNLIIRPAKPEDAESIGKLAKEFIDYLRSLGDEAEQKFDAKVYLHDEFGANPAFSGIVGEQAREISGYLLYHFGYDADHAARTLHVVDLYVSEKHRRQGIGRALMKEAGEICRAAGGAQLFWAVYEPNKKAIYFYERLGARFTQNMLYMKLDLSTDNKENYEPRNTTDTN